MTALTLLCEIIALGGKAVAASYRDHPGFSALLRHGYLCEAGVSSSVVCDGCDEAHTAPVVFEGGRYGYYCPELGFVALDRTEVQTVLPDLQLLIDGLAEAIDCKRRKRTPVHGRTYRVGALNTDAGETILYFHPKLQSEEDAREITHALGREVRARWRLMITAVGTLPVSGAQSVQLDDLASLDPETGTLRILTDPAELAGIPPKNNGGRPSKHGAALAEIISDRQEFGAALTGLNAEAKAIRADFAVRHPGQSVPSVATTKRHLAKARSPSI